MNVCYFFIGDLELLYWFVWFYWDKVVESEDMGILKVLYIGEVNEGVRDFFWVGGYFIFGSYVGV